MDYTKSQRGRLPKLFYRLMDVNGDGSGSHEAIGNYSGAEEIFYVQPAAGEVIRIARLIVSIGDTTAMQAQEYGNLGFALTNGVNIRVQDDSGTIIDITNGHTPKTNAEWGHLCYDVDVKTWGAGNELLLARFTFQRAGTLLRLTGDNNERLEVVLNDNFTGLLDHHFMAQGYYENITV